MDSVIDSVSKSCARRPGKLGKRAHKNQRAIGIITGSRRALNGSTPIGSREIAIAADKGKCDWIVAAYERNLVRFQLVDMQGDTPNRTCEREAKIRRRFDG